MGQKYVSNLPTGFSASPPPDDGSTVAANKVTYATLKTKLGDPLNNWAISENTALLNAFDTSASSVTGTYLTVASDNARVLQCAGTFTLSLGDAATLGTGWYTTVKVLSGVVTISRATGGNTLDGVAANITMKAGQSSCFAVNQAGNGFVCTDNNPVFSDITDPTKQANFDLSSITTGNNRNLKAPDASGTLSIGGDVFGKALLNDYISGFGLTTASTTTYDIAAGMAADSTNTVMLVGSAISAKSQATWAAGGTAGGKLSAAAMANVTWYYWFALWKTVDGTVDYGFDVSTTPTLPSGYTKFRYIGARKTASGSTNWETFIQHGDQVTWSTPPALDVNGTALTTANRTLTAMNIPAVRVEWMGRVVQKQIQADAGIILTDPLCADVGTSSATITPLGDMVLSTNIVTSVLNVGGQVRCWANASSQIGVRGMIGGVDVAYIQTMGWMDPRGKPV